jgi:hypothetical protein
MKLHQLAVLSIGLVSASAGVQAQSGATTPATLKARYESINRELKNAKVTHIELEGYSTEGSTLVAYTRAGTPLKFTGRYFGESGRATEEYYFWKGRLFFVLRTDWDYSIIIGQKGAPGKEIRRQERFYFEKGRLTRWLSDNNKVNDLKTTAALRSERDHLEQARVFLAMVRAKLKS